MVLFQEQALIEQTTDDQAEIITGLELSLFMVGSQFLVFSIMISRNFPTMNIIRTLLLTEVSSPLWHLERSCECDDTH